MTDNKFFAEEYKSILFNRHDAFSNKNFNNIASTINISGYIVPELLSDYKYPVCSWPVIIDSRVSSKLSKLSTIIPSLLSKIPLLYFNNNQKDIADFYFEGNEFFSQLAMMSLSKNIKVGCRLDLILTNDGFRLLEVNMGSTIGGWQIQSFEFIINSLHTELTVNTLNKGYLSKNSQDVYLKFIIEQVINRVPFEDNEINVFLGLDNIKDELKKELIVKFFNELLQKELSNRSLNGQAYSASMDQLKISNGKLFYHKTHIHSVLNIDSEDIPEAVFRSFMMDKIYLPDHLGTPLMGDKRNLAILRELAEKELFSVEENELILSSIPWSCLVDDIEVNYNNSTQNLLSLLSNSKDLFVIKVAVGFQGDDVFVGKYLSQNEWEIAISKAVSNQTFIAQEYCESIAVLAPNSRNNWVPHQLIWGSFGYGMDYGGVWVRMSALEDNVGVINSATGAVEAIVYEIK